MKTKNLFPSKWLKASDLDGDLTVTIASAKLEKVGQDSDEKKLTLYFSETDKGLTINKTNCTTLEKLYGDDTDGWLGKRIVIYPTETSFKGEMVECIRIRLRPPAGSEMRPLSWEEAKQLAAQHGLDEEWLKTELKSAGHDRFNSKAHSDLVRSLVAMSSRNPPGSDDEIPF